MAWQRFFFGVPPVNQRSTSVGDGDTYVDFVTEGLTGKILVIEVQLSEATHIKVFNDLKVFVDAELSAGHHTFPIVAFEQWLPGELGTTVATGAL